MKTYFLCWVGASLGRGAGALALLALLCLSGCKREGTRVYRVPKETPPPPPAAAAHPAPASPPAIRWKTPEGWKELAASGMRVAQFALTAEGGRTGDVSIIPLQGVSAAKEEIVNLWRGQIKLPPVGAAELPGLSQPVAMGSLQGELFEMVSAEAVGTNNDQKTRLLVAMTSQDDTMWFVKATGEDTLVQAQKSAFVEFLKTISFEAQPASSAPHAQASQVASPPPAPSANPAPAAAEGEAGGLPEWAVPSTWKSQPPTQMLLAKFIASGQASEMVEVTVSRFPGDTGGLLANVNRWRGQVGLEPVREQDLGQCSAPLELPEGKATLVDVSGTNPRTGKKARLIGAIVPRGGQTWFFKLVGDLPVAEQEKAAFIKFVQSARYPNA